MSPLPDQGQISFHREQTSNSETLEESKRRKRGFHTFFRRPGPSRIVTPKSTSPLSFQTSGRTTVGEADSVRPVNSEIVAPSHPFIKQTLDALNATGRPGLPRILTNEHYAPASALPKGSAGQSRLGDYLALNRASPAGSSTSSSPTSTAVSPYSSWTSPASSSSSPATTDSAVSTTYKRTLPALPSSAPQVTKQSAHSRKASNFLRIDPVLASQGWARIPVIQSPYVLPVIEVAAPMNSPTETSTESNQDVGITVTDVKILRLPVETSGWYTLTPMASSSDVSACPSPNTAMYERVASPLLPPPIPSINVRPGSTLGGLEALLGVLDSFGNGINGLASPDPRDAYGGIMGDESSRVPEMEYISGVAYISGSPEESIAAPVVQLSAAKEPVVWHPSFTLPETQPQDTSSSECSSARTQTLPSLIVPVQSGAPDEPSPARERQCSLPHWNAPSSWVGPESGELEDEELRHHRERLNLHDRSPSPFERNIRAPSPFERLEDLSSSSRRAGKGLVVHLTGFLRPDRAHKRAKSKAGPLKLEMPHPSFFIQGNQSSTSAVGSSVDSSDDEGFNRSPLRAGRSLDRSYNADLQPLPRPSTSMELVSPTFARSIYAQRGVSSPQINTRSRSQDPERNLWTEGVVVPPVPKRDQLNEVTILEKHLSAGSDVWEERDVQEVMNQLRNLKFTR